MAIEGKACRYQGLLMLFPCIWTQVKWIEWVKELSCIAHVEFRGVLRLWEEFTAVFPQWTRAGYRLNSPTLGKDIYIARSMELKLNGITLNCSRNHTEDKLTDRGV